MQTADACFSLYPCLLSVAFGCIDGVTSLLTVWEAPQGSRKQTLPGSKYLKWDFTSTGRVSERTLGRTLTIEPHLRKINEMRWYFIYPTPGKNRLFTAAASGKR